MTSKRLYCKLFLEDCKRKVWAFALLGLAMFFVLPVATAIRFSVNNRRVLAMSMEELAQLRLQYAHMMLDFGTDYPVVRLTLFWAAIVLGIASFSYLLDKKQVDFYHSFPAKRILLFAVHMSVGIVIPAAVYLIALVLETAVLLANGILPFQMSFWAVRGYMGHMLYYVLIYSTVVLAVMMTGTKIAALLGTAVFFAYFPSVAMLLTAYCQTFFETYTHWSYPLWASVLIRLSPMTVFSGSVSEGLLLGEALRAVGAVLALTAASLFLYQKRPLEAAGKTMAFHWSKGIVKVLLVGAFGMAGAAFFYTIQDKLGWMVFGAIVGVTISHCVIEVIYYSDFKKLFCHEKTMALCMTGVLTLALSFYFDVFRYDAYLPKEEQVEKAAIDFGEDHWVTYELVETQDSLTSFSGSWHLITDDGGTVQDIPAVLAVAREGISQLDENFVNEDYDSYCEVIVAYTLKGGRKVYRGYDMYIDPVLDEVDRIYGERDYKNALYPGLTLPAREAAAHTVYRTLGENVETLKGDEAQWEAVVEAYQEELAAMTMTRRRTEAPVGELLLISDEDDALIRKHHDGVGSWYDRYGRDDGYFYPVYSTFTKTIQALADCGIEVEHRYNVEDLQGIEITAYGPFTDQTESWEDDPGEGNDLSGELTPEDLDPDSMADPGDSLSAGFSEKEKWEYAEGTLQVEATVDWDEPYTVTYTEPEKMEEILRVFSDYGSRNKNSMLLTDTQCNVALYLSGRDAGSTTDGSMIRGKVPAFVIEDLRALERGRARGSEGGEG